MVTGNVKRSISPTQECEAGDAKRRRRCPPSPNALFFFSKSATKPPPGRGVNEALESSVAAAMTTALAPYPAWRRMLSNFWICATPFVVTWPASWDIAALEAWGAADLQYQSAEAAYHASKYLYAAQACGNAALADYASVFSINRSYQGVSIGADPKACLMAGKARTKQGKRPVPLPSGGSWERPRTADIDAPLLEAFHRDVAPAAWAAVFRAKFTSNRDCGAVLRATAPATLYHAAPRRGVVVDPFTNERHIWSVLEAIRDELLLAAC